MNRRARNIARLRFLATGPSEERVRRALHALVVEQERAEERLLEDQEAMNQARLRIRRGRTPEDRERAKREMEALLARQLAHENQAQALATKIDRMRTSLHQARIDDQLEALERTAPLHGAAGAARQH